MKHFPKLLLVSFLLTTSIQFTIAQVQTGNASIGQVEYAAFELRQPEKVNITGQGAIYSDEWSVVVFYGWIINSQTRKVVWHQLDRLNKEDDLVNVNSWERNWQYSKFGNVATIHEIYKTET